MELRFRPGDKVRLKSGGPEMTIRDQHYDVSVDRFELDVFDCIWFETTTDGKKLVEYHPYHQDQLLKTGSI